MFRTWKDEQTWFEIRLRIGESPNTWSQFGFLSFSYVRENLRPQNSWLHLFAIRPLQCDPGLWINLTHTHDMVSTMSSARVHRRVSLCESVIDAQALSGFLIPSKWFPLDTRWLDYGACAGVLLTTFPEMVIQFMFIWRPHLLSDLVSAIEWQRACQDFTSYSTESLFLLYDQNIRRIATTGMILSRLASFSQILRWIRWEDYLYQVWHSRLV